MTARPFSTVRLSGRRKSPRGIVLIQVDQLSDLAMPWEGGPAVAPELTRLAEQSVRFAQARCNSPICLPSRISMLSGQHPGRTAQFGFSGLCRRDLPWVPRTLQREGWFTGAAGKLHVLAVGWRELGFDFVAPSLPEETDIARPPEASYRHYCKRRRLPFPTDQIHGHDPDGPGSIVLSRFASRDDSSMGRLAVRSEIPVAHSLETWTTDRGLDFVAQARSERRPFFLWLSYDRPHFPLTLPPEIFFRLDYGIAGAMVSPEQDVSSLCESYVRELRNGPSQDTLGASWARALACYYALVKWIDSEIGRFLERLAQWGWRDEVDVLFTSDHGDEGGRAGLFDKGRGAFSEAVTRVPLLFCPAKFRRISPRTVRQPVDLIDIGPTLCELAGVAVPPEMEGRSFARATQSARECSFCEDAHAVAVSTEGWKLVIGEVRSDQHLFSLSRDLDCTRSLHRSPIHRRQRILLKKQLARFLAGNVFGSYTSRDSEQIRMHLEEEGKCLPLAQQGPDGVTWYRAAIAYKAGSFRLLLTFWDLAHFTWSHSRRTAGDFYLRRSTRKKKIPLEPLLDGLLEELMRRRHSVSYQFGPPIRSIGKTARGNRHRPAKDRTQRQRSGGHSFSHV